MQKCPCVCAGVYHCFVLLFSSRLKYCVLRIMIMFHIHFVLALGCANSIHLPFLMCCFFFFLILLLFCDFVRAYWLCYFFILFFFWMALLTLGGNRPIDHCCQNVASKCEYQLFMFKWFVFCVIYLIVFYVYFARTE